MAEQNVLIELYYDSGSGAAWQDITSYVRIEDGIRTQVGQQDEAGQPTPSSCSFVLNTAGLWLPYDPTSPVYGRVGRNTPVRLRVGGLYRFQGEVARWDLVASDGVSPERTPVEAAGMLRRISQGAKPLASAPRRYIQTRTTPLAYWPLEDSETSGKFVPIVNGSTVNAPLGVNLADDSEAFPASNPLPTLDAPVTFPVPTSVGTASPYVVRFFLLVPSGTGAGTVVSLALSGGSFGRIDLNYSTAAGGSLTPAAYDPSGSALTMAVSAWTSVDNTPLLVTIYQNENGPTSASWFHRYDVVSRDGFISSGTTYGNTNLGRTRGTLTSVTFGSSAASGIVVGHLAMYSAIPPLATDAIAGWAGEAANSRAFRIGQEAGVLIGANSSSPAAAALGVQRPGSAIELLREVVDSDGGLLYDSHLSKAIVYRSTASMYNQHEVLAVTAGLDRIRAPLAPVVDDQNTRNDVEVVNRHTGTTQRAVATTGPLSVADAPAGVGRYDVSVAVNLQSDIRAANHAAMLVHRGTVSAARYPRVTLELSDADSAFLTAVHSVSPGSMIRLQGPPGSGGGYVDLVALGWSEHIGSHTRRITFVCAPAEPYTVLRLDNSTYGRVGSTVTLATAQGPSSTSWPIDLVGGAPVAIAGGQFPIQLQVGGEQVTATACSNRVALGTATRPVAATAPWYYQDGTGGAGTVTFVNAEGPPGLVGYLRRTVTTADTGGNAGLYWLQDGITSGTAGQIVTASIWVRHSAAVPVQVTAQYRASGNFLTGGGASSAAITLVPNTWTRLSVTLPPSPASWDGFYVWGRESVSGPAVGSTSDFTGVLVEVAPNLGPYIEGTSTTSQRLTVARAVNGITKSHTPGATIIPLYDPRLAI